MGPRIYRRIALLIVLFILTTLIVYQELPSTRSKNQTKSLGLALSDIDGWRIDGSIPLEPSILEALELDDYANQIYSKDGVKVYLYIGFYNTTMKVGAAHDPMVCFPGQGWEISGRKSGELAIDSPRPFEISYSSMIANRGDEKQLVIYWFQSYNFTASNTFVQKLQSLYQKVFHNREENAFVRVSVPIGGSSIASGRDAMVDFIRAFYPVFLNYMKVSTPRIND